MKDRYLNPYNSLCRLITEYRQYGSLYVAFDFDGTVYDYHNLGDTYPGVISLLKECKQLGFKLILFTSNDGDRLQFIINECDILEIKPDYINESPIMKTKKPYYNILLDDRAGLNEAFLSLYALVNDIKNNKYNPKKKTKKS